MNPDDLNGPVCIDRDRMDRALATPTFTLPSGLTGEQIVAVLNIFSQTSRLAANAEREAIATMILNTKEWRGRGGFSTLCDDTKHVIASAIRAQGSQVE